MRGRIGLVVALTGVLAIAAPAEAQTRADVGISLRVLPGAAVDVIPAAAEAASLGSREASGVAIRVPAGRVWRLTRSEPGVSEEELARGQDAAAVRIPLPGDGREPAIVTLSVFAP
jgi:hypothetical protein